MKLAKRNKSLPCKLWGFPFFPQLVCFGISFHEALQINKRNQRGGPFHLSKFHWSLPPIHTDCCAISGTPQTHLWVSFLPDHIKSCTDFCHRSEMPWLIEESDACSAGEEWESGVERGCGGQEEWNGMKQRCTCSYKSHFLDTATRTWDANIFKKHFQKRQEGFQLTGGERKKMFSSLTWFS